MRFRLRVMFGVALVLCFVATANAQRPEGGRFGGGFGGFPSRLALLRIEAVQKELSLTPDQVTAIQKLQEELSPRRGGGEGERPRRRPGNENNDARLPAPAERFFVQQDQPRRQPSDEDRQRFRQQAEERAKKEKEKLAEILKPEQLKRLNEIYVRVAGVAALNDADVAKQLEITDEQKEKMAKVREETMTAMRELFTGGGDREANRAKFEELRKSSEEKTLAVLTDAQKKKFEELKGKPFDLPADALRRGRGGDRPQNN